MQNRNNINPDPVTGMDTWHIRSWRKRAVCKRQPSTVESQGSRRCARSSPNPLTGGTPRGDGPERYPLERIRKGHHPSPMGCTRLSHQSERRWERHEPRSLERNILLARLSLAATMADWHFLPLPRRSHNLPSGIDPIWCIL